MSPIIYCSHFLDFCSSNLPKCIIFRLTSIINWYVSTKRLIQVSHNSLHSDLKFDLLFCVRCAIVSCYFSVYQTKLCRGNPIEYNILHHCSYNYFMRTRKVLRESILNNCDNILVIDRCEGSLGSSRHMKYVFLLALSK